MMSKRLMELLPKFGNNQQEVIEKLKHCRLHEDGAFELLCELAVYGLKQLPDDFLKGVKSE